jgi:hypothetical protein
MTGMRGLYIFLSIVAVTLMVLFTATSFALKGKANWDDLLLNLGAEVFGILATVFFIERIIRSREEQELLPVKHLIYDKLLEAISRFERELLYPLFLQDEQDLPPLTSQSFSQPSVALQSLRGMRDKHTLQTRFQEVLVDGLTEQLLRVEDPRHEQIPEYGNWPVWMPSEVESVLEEVREILATYRTVVPEVLDTWAHLLEPTLLNILQRLDGRIEEALRTSDPQDHQFGIFFREGRSRDEYERNVREQLDVFLNPVSSAVAEVIQQSWSLGDWIENEISKRRRT